MYTVLTPVRLQGEMVDNDTVCKGKDIVVDTLVTELQLSLRKKMVGVRLDKEKKYVWNVKNTAGRIEIKG
jgi:hypothetical protein